MTVRPSSVRRSTGSRTTLARTVHTPHAAHCYTSHSSVLQLSVIFVAGNLPGWLGSRVVSVLDSGAEGRGLESQSRRCRVTVLGKLFTPIVPLHQAVKLVAALLGLRGYMWAWRK